MTKRDKNRASQPARTQRGILPTAVVFAMLACACVWYAWTRGLSLEDVLARDDLADFAFDWPSGTTYTYTLGWSAKQSNRMIQPQQGASGQVSYLTGDLQLDADLVLRSYGKVSDVHVLGISLASIGDMSWRVLGQDVVAQAALSSTFEKREAYVEIEAGGRIRRTYFASDAPSEFRGLMQWLVPQLQFTLAPTRSAWAARGWSLVEGNVHGKARSAYKVEDAAPLVLGRTRARYESLLVGDVRTLRYQSDDVATARCAQEGHLEAVESHVGLKVSDAGGAVLGFEESFRLTLREVKAGPTLPMLALGSAGFQGYAAGETPLSAAADQQALVNRVGNLTAGEMVSNVLEFANGGRMDQRWLWQATGLMQLHPEACAELAAVFDDAGFTHKGRALILDLLASTGTDEAQKALRRLLDSEVARENPTTEAVFFNRVALVSEANAETAQYVAQRYDAHAQGELGPMRVASAYALGAVAGHQREQGDPGAAAALSARLVDGLEQAESPGEQAVMLRALGNAGLPENVEKVAGFASHESSGVRAAAAEALRQTHTEQSLDALLALLRDPEWQVQQAALSSLAEYDLAVEEAQQIEDLIVAEVVGSRNDPLLVTVLSRNASPEHPLAAGFGHVLTRNQKNGQLAARIRAIARRNGVTL